MKFDFFKTNKSDALNDADRDLQLEIKEELLRELRLIFNLAVFVNTSAALIILFGVGLLYFNKIPEASLTTGGGVLASLCSFQSAKEAKEELRQLMTKLPK